MYQRIKNKLDLEIVEKFLKAEKVEQAVLKRVEELVEVLDREYGCCRGSSDMGGYVCFSQTGKPMRTIFQNLWNVTILRKPFLNTQNESAEQKMGSNGGKNFTCCPQMTHWYWSTLQNRHRTKKRLSWQFIQPGIEKHRKEWFYGIPYLWHADSMCGNCRSRIVFSVWMLRRKENGECILIFTGFYQCDNSI